MINYLKYMWLCTYSGERSESLTFRCYARTFPDHASGRTVEDLNPRHQVLETCVLPTELTAQQAQDRGLEPLLKVLETLVLPITPILLVVNKVLP